MNPAEPPRPPEGDQVRVVMGEGQPDYLPLPSHRGPGPFHAVSTWWQPNEDERGILAAGGLVRLVLLTFGDPLQPISITAEPRAPFVWTTAEDGAVCDACQRGAGSSGIAPACTSPRGCRCVRAAAP